MSRKTINFNSKFEQMAGYSRAVVDGDFVVVSGTVGADPETGEFPESIEEQLRFAFDLIEDALGKADVSLANVLICRVYLTDRDYVERMAAFLRKKFEGINPANTTIICQLPPPDAKVEVEVFAKKY
mgnify:CR=1 FL=1